MVLSNFHYLGLLLIWITVRQVPAWLAAGADEGLNIFPLTYHLVSFSLSLRDCLIQTEILSQEPLIPKQPTNPDNF